MSTEMPTAMPTAMPTEMPTEMPLSCTTAVAYIQDGEPGPWVGAVTPQVCEADVTGCIKFSGETAIFQGCDRPGEFRLCNSTVSNSYMGCINDAGQIPGQQVPEDAIIRCVSEDPGEPGDTPLEFREELALIVDSCALIEELASSTN